MKTEVPEWSGNLQARTKANPTALVGAMFLLLVFVAISLYIYIGMRTTPAGEQPVVEDTKEEPESLAAKTARLEMLMNSENSDPDDMQIERQAHLSTSQQEKPLGPTEEQKNRLRALNPGAYIE